MIQKENKIGEVVAENFRTAKVFEEFGLDFCCGGKKSIAAACSEKGVDSEAVLEKLGNTANGEEPQIHYNRWSADFLTDYIINNHHSYVMNAIPVIEQHLEKVVFKHGEKYLYMQKVKLLFETLKDELLSHMMKEERMLFPYIKKMHAAKESSSDILIPPFGNVENPIRVMEAEHDQAGELMGEINMLTNNYTPPEDACTTHRVLLGELRDFEQDLHMHVHLENNILFPKAKELESQLINKTK